MGTGEAAEPRATMNGSPVAVAPRPGWFPRHVHPGFDRTDQVDILRF